MNIMIAAILLPLAASSAAEKKAGEPAYLQPIRKFEAGLVAKDVDGCLAAFDRPADERAAAKLRRKIESMVKGWDQKRKLPVTEHRAQGDCAVAVVLEKPTDPDPFYLVRREAGWRILPEVTQYKRSAGLSPKQIADFEELEKWFREQEAAAREKAGKKAGKATPAAKAEEAPAAPPGLFDAIFNGKTKAVEKFLAEGGSGETVNRSGETLLYVAVKANRPAIVKLLLDGKAKVDAVTKLTGRTALFEAACDGRLEIARLLIARGANVNARNVSGATPLHDAAAGGSAEMVKLLLEKGADPSAIDRDKKTPADLAPAGAGGDEIRRLLASRTGKKGR
jgi:hypothetical protein